MPASSEAAQPRFKDAENKARTLGTPFWLQRAMKRYARFTLPGLSKRLPKDDFPVLDRNKQSNLMKREAKRKKVPVLRVLREGEVFMQGTSLFVLPRLFRSCPFKIPVWWRSRSTNISGGFAVRPFRKMVSEQWKTSFCDTVTNRQGPWNTGTDAATRSDRCHGCEKET